MNQTVRWISGCIVALLLAGLLIGGPVACSMSQQREATKRIQALCAGDLTADRTRAAICLQVTNNAKSANQ